LSRAHLSSEEFSRRILEKYWISRKKFSRVSFQFVSWNLKISWPEWQKASKASYSPNAAAYFSVVIVLKVSGKICKKYRPDTVKRPGGGTQLFEWRNLQQKPALLNPFIE